MPQHKSAIKRLRQSEKRMAHNRSRRSKLRTLIKKVLESSSKKEGEAALLPAVAYLDRMGVKNLLHKNNVARKKSRLTKYVNGLK
ncbi:MAG: 30S ribosomal protein S20 [Bacteroidetes bacterium]|nr:30S ribosomal protein S20 [Bacteroidota bacterium]